MKHLINKMRASFATLLLASAIMPASAQFLRTSYGMEGTHYRQQINPALTPGRGYLNLPVIGSFNATVSSNAFGYTNVMEMIDNKSGADYFMSNSFMDNLKAKNTLNLNLSTDILSAGWYKGKNFWSFNVGVKMDFGAALPKSVFEFMRTMQDTDWENPDNFDGKNVSFGGEELNINSYAEVGLGFARQINSKWTVGGRAKVLLGLANMKMNVNTVDAELNAHLGTQDLNFSDVDWGMVARLADGDMEAIRYCNDLGLADFGGFDNEGEPIINSHVSGTASLAVDASMECSLNGLENPWDDNGDLNEIKFNKFGISGWGLGFDVGATYQPIKNLKLSASLLDVGFLKWQGKNTLKGEAILNETRTYEASDGAQLVEFAEAVGSGELLNYDLLKLKEVEGKDRTTSLAATLAIGAEYSLLNNWLVVGALSTTRFTQPKALTELTFSANIRPKNWFNVALSYSMIQSAGKSFGLAAKLGPVFVGTDYMFFGKDTKTANAYLGVSLPLGAKKK